MKGYEKKVFFIKKLFVDRNSLRNTEDGISDKADFLVNRDKSSSSGCSGERSFSRLGEGDMIDEANRIITESLIQSGAVSKRDRGRFYLKFLATFFLGAIFTAALFLTFNFILS